MNGLVVQQLTFAYRGGAPILAGLDLTVSRGEVVCLLGANGSGKSTLLACIMGFLSPPAGSISVDGVDCQENPKEARQKLAYLPESVALWGFLTAVEHVRLIAEMTGTSPDPASLLRRAGLAEEVWSWPVARFSKGMRQKLALVLATIRQPSVALLDEPTSGLDPDSAQAMVLSLRSLADEGVGVLVVTHDLWLVAQAAQRFGFLRGGRIVHQGQASDRQVLAGLFTGGSGR